MAMLPAPDVDQSGESKLPRGAKNLGDRFILLHARDEKDYTLRECEALALCTFLGLAPVAGEILVCRWAKLQIPTGQNCYSAWKEEGEATQETSDSTQYQGMFASCTFFINSVQLLTT
jgi:hypothetical protein